MNARHLSTIHSDILSLLYMTFERLVPIKRAEVYDSWSNKLTDLSVLASDLATSSQDKIEEIFRQVSFPWHCYIAYTHKVVQSCLLQKEEHTHN